MKADAGPKANTPLFEGFWPGEINLGLGDGLGSVSPGPEDMACPEPSRGRHGTAPRPRPVIGIITHPAEDPFAGETCRLKCRPRRPAFTCWQAVAGPAAKGLSGIAGWVNMGSLSLRALVPVLPGAVAVWPFE